MLKTETNCFMSDEGLRINHVILQCLMLKNRTEYLSYVVVMVSLSQWQSFTLYFHSEENNNFKHTQNARRYKCIKSNIYLFEKKTEQKQVLKILNTKALDFLKQCLQETTKRLPCYLLYVINYSIIFIAFLKGTEIFCCFFVA